jgi:hypothetical protein
VIHELAEPEPDRRPVRRDDRSSCGTRAQRGWPIAPRSRHDVPRKHCPALQVAQSRSDLRPADIDADGGPAHGR